VIALLTGLQVGLPVYEICRSIRKIMKDFKSIVLILKIRSAEGIINDPLTTMLFKLLVRKENMANLRNGGDIL
jgi:hypothetical protein